MSTAKKVSKTASKTVVLKTICAELKVEPKAARRKLRASGLSFHDKRERWTFNPNQAKQVREILSA